MYLFTLSIYLYYIAIRCWCACMLANQWPISSRTANVWKGQSPLQSPIVAKFLKASGKAASLYINMVKYIYVLSLCLFIYKIGYYLSIYLSIYLSQFLSISLCVYISFSVCLSIGMVMSIYPSHCIYVQIQSQGNVYL